MKKTTEIEQYSISLVLVFLMVACNYIGDTLNCSLQRYFTHSRYVKFLICFLVIFILVIITNKFYDDKHPKELLKISVYLLILYILSTKNKPFAICITLLLWFIIYYIQILKNYKYKIINNLDIKYYSDVKYLMKISNLSKNEIEEYLFLNKISNFCFILSIIILSMGAIHYYFAKKKEYKKNWNLKHFLIGKNICKSINKGY